MPQDCVREALPTRLLTFEPTKTDKGRTEQIGTASYCKALSRPAVGVRRSARPTSESSNIRFEVFPNYQIWLQPHPDRWDSLRLAAPPSVHGVTPACIV
jgi:hypothetical protein